MFVVLHYPLGTVRQQLSQDHVLQERERVRVMFVVLHYPLGTVRQQLSQDHVLQERERVRVMFVVLHYPLGTVRQQLSQDHVLQERERELELCSWYCTIHSALSDNSSARITSYKRERESYVRGTALSTRHCQTIAQPGSRPTSERERVMLVVLHYPLGTVRQQLSQDHVLTRERESYARGTALSTRHCQTTAQPGSRPTRERESYARGTALSTRHCQTTAQPESRPTREVPILIHVLAGYPTSLRFTIMHTFHAPPSLPGQFQLL